MNISLKSNHKKLKAIATVAAGLFAGIAILMVMKSGKAEVVVDSEPVAFTRVTVAVIEPVQIQPSLAGFGTLEPDVELTISSEITGTVNWVNSDLKAGKLFTQGTLALRLDDTDVTLSLKQTQSELAVKNAQLQQKKLEFINSEKTLESAKARLQLATGELDRQTSLVADGLFSFSNLDKQKQQVINQQTEVANIELSLAVMPGSIQILEAEVDSTEARLSQRQRDMARTKIYVKKDGRIGRVQVEEGSFVMTGSKLFDLSSSDYFEINVQVPAKQYQQVFRGKRPESLGAIVSVNQYGVEKKLDASVQGFDDGLDAGTRMLGVIVLVQNSDALVKGAYAKVALVDSPTVLWMVPRSAIHQGNLYWADENNQLKIMPAKVAYTQGDFAVLAGQPAYQNLVTSALFPAIEGMPLDTYPDPTFLDLLAKNSPSIALLN